MPIPSQNCRVHPVTKRRALPVTAPFPSQNHAEDINQRIPSIPILFMRPYLVQRDLQALDVVDVEVFQRVRIFEVAGLLYVRRYLRQMPGIIFVYEDHALTGVAVRSPEPIVLVFTDCFGKPVFSSEIIDGTRLAVVAGLDPSPGLDVRRQAVKYACHLYNHRLPAKFVGIILR